MKEADAATLGLEIVRLPTAKIHPNPWNPNRQSEVVARAERESIEHFGFIDPVTVRPHPTVEGEYEVIDGEHRWRTAMDLGYEEIPAVILELTDAEARRLTIVLNETRGDADVVLLGMLLTELQAMTDEDGFAIALPYTSNELDHLLSIGAEDWDQFRQQIDGATLPPDSTLREVTLTMEADVYDRFTRWLQMLAKEWELPDAGATELVVEAVRRSALAVNQGEPAA